MEGWLSPKQQMTLLNPLVWGFLLTWKFKVFYFPGEYLLFDEFGVWMVFFVFGVQIITSKNKVFGRLCVWKAMFFFLGGGRGVECLFFQVA